VPLETVSSQADSAASIPLTCSRRKSGCSSCSGEEFLYCVKAAGFADRAAAVGRACGLRPVPPSAAHEDTPTTGCVPIHLFTPPGACVFLRPDHAGTGGRSGHVQLRVLSPPLG